MKIQEIELNHLQGHEIAIALVQLRSPFFEELDQIRHSSGSYTLAITKKNQVKYQNRIRQLKLILDQINNRFMDANIIVLPEYAFLKNDRDVTFAGMSTYDVCKEYVAKTKKIMIGNFYDDDERSSRTFMLIPSRNDQQPDLVSVYEATKYTRTSYDAPFLEPLSAGEDDPHILRAHWTSGGREAFIEIFTCKDYLYFTSIDPLRNWPDIIRTDLPGIIICPMCSPDMSTFQSKAMVLLREPDGIGDTRSIVSCFCNATANSDMAIRERHLACGYSQVISPIDIHTQSYKSLRTGLEGIVFSVVNPFKSLAKPTPTSEPEANAVLISSNTYTFISPKEDELHIVEHGNKSRYHTGFVVNPFVLQEMGYHRIYGFLMIGDYKKFKHTLKIRSELLANTSTAMHGIYGIHDVLALSWEETSELSRAREMLKIRIWPMLSNESEVDQKRLGCCIVERFMKFHGIILSNEKIINPHLRHYDNDDFRLIIRDAMLRKKLDSALIESLKNDSILLETIYDNSDLSDRERDEGKMEFLVMVCVRETGSTLFEEGVKKRFEETILADLLRDERVRTIEQVTADGSAYVNTNYILHVVGSVDDLNSVIIDCIHDQKNKLGAKPPFQCKTTVIISAEALSVANHIALLEEPKNRSAEAGVIDLMNRWKKLGKDGDVINMLPSSLMCIQDDCLYQILSTSMQADTFLKSENQDDEDFLDLLYAISAAIGGAKLGNPMDPREFTDRATPFITNMAREVESISSRLFSCFCKMYDIQESDFESGINELIETHCDKKGKGKLSIKVPELGACGMTFDMLNGVARDGFREEHKNRLLRIPNTETVDHKMEILSKIANIKFDYPYDDFSRLLKAFSSIRNAFLHTRDVKIEPQKVLDGVYSGLKYYDGINKFLAAQKIRPAS